MTVLSRPRHPIVADALSLIQDWCAGHIADDAPAFGHAVKIALTLGRHVSGRQAANRGPAVRSRERVVGCVDNDQADDDDTRDDLLARVVAMVTDPFYGKPVPAPRHTAAEIIAMAEAKLQHQAAHPSEERTELSAVDLDRRAAALVAAVLDDRLARRLRGRWWFTYTGRNRPNDRGRERRT